MWRFIKLFCELGLPVDELPTTTTHFARVRDVPVTKRSYDTSVAVSVEHVSKGDIDFGRDGMK